VRGIGSGAPRRGNTGRVLRSRPTPCDAADAVGSGARRAWIERASVGIGVADGSWVDKITG
jgi:hypothetical protein